MAGKTIQDQTSTYPDQNLTKFLNVEPVESIVVPGPSGSVVIDGSQVSIPGLTADTAVLAYTASTAPSYLPLVGGTITGNLTVNGTTTFNNLVINTSSYSSGSTVFGDALSDTHQFTGSVSITGSSLTWNSSTLIASNITSSMSVASASQALTASYAVNSSYKIVTDTTAGTSSNSTSEVLLKSLLIPANTFPANSVLTIQWLLSKIGTNDIIYHYLKANTSATLVGATQLAIRSVVAAQRYIPNYRRLAIRVANGTGNGSLIYDPTVGAATSDLNENASPPVTVSIDWTNDVYLLVSGYVVSASDSIQVEYLTINN
jgi:hypothetical protein